MIRKVKDQSQRMALLSKFLTTFQGTKVDNWVKCNAGDHNLLCVHELLQIYQFLRPGDVSVLNKDIQLNFAGGHFQGYYICRNCGQPISELEYDTHLEYDDSGRPMMGRSELVDKDAITQEQIELLVGPMGDVEIPESFFNRLKTNEPEIDDMFGDGILPGSTATIISDPGVGKSILCLTILEKLTLQNYKVGYTSGEEDISQIAYNVRRLGIEQLQTATITDIDEIADAMQHFDVLVIDSFQCLTTKKDLNSRAQVQYFANTIVKKAKEHKCSVFVIVQKTSSGEIKGGTTLPFAVDINIRISKDVDVSEEFRVLEVYKNRFGQTGKYEMEMTQAGYVFKGKYIEPVESSTKTSKQPVSEMRKQMIIDMIEPPLITIERVIDELGVGHQTASNLLRELVYENKLKKFGRGSESIWKHKSVDAPTFLESSMAAINDQLNNIQHEQV
jgi:KaiC/GvpD/RAD55 family RecA-like ATPase